MCVQQLADTNTSNVQPPSSSQRSKSPTSEPCEDPEDEDGAGDITQQRSLLSSKVPTALLHCSAGVLNTLDLHFRHAPAHATAPAGVNHCDHCKSTLQDVDQEASCSILLRQLPGAVI